jgi:two-component system, OmpR family, heavy metal sensor histidine kinase CusS
LIRLSLKARLTLLFAVIMTTCFVAVGAILFDALEDQIYAENDLSIVLAARHLRRLASEMDNTDYVREHQARLVSLVLGDPALAMKVDSPQGQSLIDYNPPMLSMITLQPIPADKRIVVEQLTHWVSQASPVRGIATLAPLRDGTTIQISVARSMQDRVDMLARYGTLIWATELIILIIGILLSLVFVRRALKPLDAIAADAHSITTERLDARIDVRRAPGEFQDLAVTLNTMLQRLERGFERMWHFTTDLAHDLRTPIANMRGASEVALARARSPSEYQSLLASNIEECDRLSRMIENVLFLARAESPQFGLARVSFDAAEELQRIREYFEGLAEEGGIRIEVRGSARISAERELFRRAVNNLLVNALRYTPRGGTILLTASGSDAEVVIAVENPGPGIPPEEITRIFERFYRADPARSVSTEASGLGLAIVKTIMDLHGGKASVRSEVGGQTVFELHFPNTTQSAAGKVVAEGRQIAVIWLLMALVGAGPAGLRASEIDCAANSSTWGPGPGPYCYVGSILCESSGRFKPATATPASRGGSAAIKKSRGHPSSAEAR